MALFISLSVRASEAVVSFGILTGLQASIHGDLGANRRKGFGSIGVSRPELEVTFLSVNSPGDLGTRCPLWRKNELTFPWREFLLFGLLRD